ncbi:oxidoreductase, FAD-binding protein [Polaribacter irgensii 23-P]|uniref:Oxidoreductase, FAD-binding protein n=1 Tax=Polaribacter irgensii 23-P TaxID=313594 RepID=A4BWD9_9FLAO|nr:FAD-dependent oxidoreductase [Polaribacter irgensii]EAR13280.1 oxidoreductase, FAD-binding protein [Polaribacter irgensii 23-P]
MEKSAYKIHIIGAGVSGLIAAQILENYGYHPTIIEASSSVGGRVKSDVVKGHLLDRGFQVLLTSYPAAKKYLDYDRLELQKLLPGATIFKNGKSQTIGDPLRKISLLIPTLRSSVGSFTDKVKILKLNALLKKKKIEAIFKTEETTTLQYLKDFGFSNEIITDFFTPFFSGIFLEPHLETSSRMFEFVYKMFGEGLAVIPKKGIQAIPNQLKSNLTQTKIRLNSAVKQVKNNLVILEDGEEIKSDFTIIATEASALISNLKNQETQWKSCDTLYFECEKREINKPLIGLISDKNTLINNIFYPTSIASKAPGDKELLCVTIVKKHEITETELIAKTKEELKTFCGISDLVFLKRYQIKKALPELTNIQYALSSTETQLNSSLFLAGDQLLNASLNAAMIAGERAAMGVIKTLEDGLIADELSL